MAEPGAPPPPEPTTAVSVQVEVTVSLVILADGRQRVGFRASTDDPDLCFAALMGGLGALYGKARAAAAEAAVEASPIIAANGVPFRHRT